MRQVTSGIKGLDLILRGGYPEERTILISGPAGAGKSTFGLQFLVSGITQYDSPGVYISFDETLDNVRSDAASYGWDLKALEDQNLLVLVDGFSERAGIESQEKYSVKLDVDEMLNLLIKLIDAIGAERVVIDSLTAVSLSLDSELVVRKEILKLSGVMSALTCTTLMISESVGDVISRMKVAEFMAQGVITLKYEMNKNGRRTIQVRKMRGIKHSLKERPFLISDSGIEVFHDEEIYNYKM